MLGPYVHRIDPVLAEVWGVYLWWYGLSYTLGFLEIHLWFKRAHQRLGLTPHEVYSLSLFFILGVLLGGRFVEVVFYERPFYSQHPWLIPAYWLGGMATHGLLLGATTGTWLFCRLYGKSFLSIADELVIPGAFLLGVGRIGNFIDAQRLDAGYPGALRKATPGTPLFAFVSSHRNRSGRSRRFAIREGTRAAADCHNY